MRGIMAALAMAGLVSPVTAEQGAQAGAPPPAAEEPLTIWNNLKVGMTKEEFRALYPKRDVPIADGCFAYVDGDFEKGKLVRVNLEWSTKDKSKQCGAMITQTLLAKYGEPEQTEQSIKSNSCGNRYAKGVAGALAQLCSATGGDEPDVFGYAKWVRNGVEILLKRASVDEATWWMVYRPAVQPSPEAASKL